MDTMTERNTIMVTVGTISELTLLSPQRQGCHVEESSENASGCGTEC